MSSEERALGLLIVRKLVHLVLAVLLIGSGGFLVYDALTEQPVRTPDVVEPWVAPKDQELTGPTIAPVVPSDVPESDEPTPDSVMSPEQMKVSTLFIPSIGAYGPVDNSGDFGASKDGVLVLPPPSAVTRWEDGSSLGDDKGNVLVTGHVSYSGVRGVLHDLALAKPGSLAYLKDDDGKLFAFKLMVMESYNKSALPDDLWKTDTPNRLALVTCGGELLRVGDSWHYENNIVTYWDPVSL